MATKENRCSVEPPQRNPLPKTQLALRVLLLAVLSSAIPWVAYVYFASVRKAFTEMRIARVQAQAFDRPNSPFDTANDAKYSPGYLPGAEVSEREEDYPEFAGTESRFYAARTMFLVSLGIGVVVAAVGGWFFYRAASNSRLVSSLSWQLETMCIVAAVAFAIMITHAATAFGRNPMLDVANLFPPAVAFCLAGLLVRNRPAVSKIMMVSVVVWSAILVCAYLLADCVTSGFLWLFQWAAGLAAIIIATVFRLAGNPPISEAGGAATGSRARGVLMFTFVGFVAGVVLGLGLSWLVFSFELGGKLSEFAPSVSTSSP